MVQRSAATALGDLDRFEVFVGQRLSISALGRLEPWFMGEQINQKEFLRDFEGRNRAGPAAVPSVKTMVPLTPGPLHLRSAELSVDSGRRIEPLALSRSISAYLANHMI